MQRSGRQGEGVGSVFLSMRGGRGDETHSVKAWSRAIFNLLRQPDRAGLYIVRQRQLG